MAPEAIKGKFPMINNTEKIKIILVYQENESNR
jgi:hypothetical protein